MSFKYRLMFIPSICADSYVLVTSRGQSVAVRDYRTPTEEPRPDRSHVLSRIESEAGRAGARVILEERHSTEDARHWWKRIQLANRLAKHEGHLQQPEGTGQSNLGAPKQPAPGARFVDHRGRPLAEIADWQALHPSRHWKAGFSAMELARSWHHAGGFPSKVAEIVQAEPFGQLALERAIAECRTAVPGEGRPSHTDLMIEAVDSAGARVVIAVEGKVRESFGPLVGAWLREVDHQRSAANKLERLQGLCEGLGLVVDTETESLRYQLLHRAWAALRHAAEVGATRAILLVHSFAPYPDTDNREAFGAFLRAMGQPEATLGKLLPLGRRRGVDLWAAWVSDTPLPAPLES